MLYFFNSATKWFWNSAAQVAIFIFIMQPSFGWYKLFVNASFFGSCSIGCAAGETLRPYVDPIYAGSSHANMLQCVLKYEYPPPLSLLQATNIYPVIRVYTYTIVTLMISFCLFNKVMKCCHVQQSYPCGATSGMLNNYTIFTAFNTPGFNLHSFCSVWIKNFHTEPV